MKNCNINFEDIYESYLDCRKHKRNSDSQLDFEIDLSKNLVELFNDIGEDSYNISDSIAFCVTVPKPREVFAANFRDRIIHHFVIRKLEPLFEKEFINDTYNCRKGKGVLYGVNRLKEQTNQALSEYGPDCWYGKFDMSSFFMSIDKKVLWKKLKSFIEANYKEDDKDLILDLTNKILFDRPQDHCEIRGSTKTWRDLPNSKSLFCADEFKGLPIGNLTSQIFANFYLCEFDKMMVNEFKYYGRYVDDFFVIVKNKKEAKRARRLAKKFLSERLKIEINEDKTYIEPVKFGCKFIGSVVKLDRVYIGNRVINYAMENIKVFNENIEDSCIDIFIATMNSYLGFMHHGNTFNQRKKLIKLIDPGWYKYIKVDRDYKKLIKKHENGGY